MRSRFSHIDFGQGFHQASQAIKVIVSTPSFITKHKLWKGFLSHHWILFFSILFACLFSYLMYQDIHDYFILQDQVGFNGEGHAPLFSGSLKFLILIFLEVIIFHFAIKANNHLKSENNSAEFKEFYRAQIRMVIILGRKWLYGLLMYVLVYILCSVTQTSFLITYIMIFIYGYFLGFAFLVNYLEQYDFSLKKSAKRIQSHFGASIVFGLLATFLLHIPLVGPLLVPFLCGIAATRYGHQAQMEL